MNKRDKTWKVVGRLKPKSKKPMVEEIVDVLLKNRGIKTKKQKLKFLDPKSPFDISLSNIGVPRAEVERAVDRVRKSFVNDENIVTYGDYDADGICATAILWEVLYAKNKNVMPHIPDRFKEGYGLNSESISILKDRNPNLSLIITVDNGIVAYDAVDRAKSLGIDVIVTDHHQKERKSPKAHSVIHSDAVSGAGLAWLFAKEVAGANDANVKGGLELAAIGTIADQVPLLGVNRSIAKYGLEKLRTTQRPGLISLYENSGLDIVRKVRNLPEYRVGSYEVGYIIAPRINAMGRLEHGIDSLRLLCTQNRIRASSLATTLGETNSERQKIVEQVVEHVRSRIVKTDNKEIIVLSHSSYHEGVIGLAASRIAEEYQMPTIMISEGEEISKASARSIDGFNIIEAIRECSDVVDECGGHPMAAGFSIETNKIEAFERKLKDISTLALKGLVGERSFEIDLEIGFGSISQRLANMLEKFEPSGIANPKPTFLASDVEVLGARTVGGDGRHLKMKLQKNGKVIDAIAFGFGDYYPQLLQKNKIDIVFGLELNEWRGKKTLQIKVRDMKI